MLRSHVQADAVAGEITQTDAAAGETVVGEQSSSVQADPLAGEAAQSDAAAGGSALPTYSIVENIDGVYRFYSIE